MSSIFRETLQLLTQKNQGGAMNDSPGRGQASASASATEAEEDEEEEEAVAALAGGYTTYNSPEDTIFTVPIFGHELSFRQMPADRTLGHGAVVWEAAVIFSKWVEISNDFSVANMSGKRVLELGSGTGLAGVALMMRGARVVFSDLAPVCVALTEPNVTSNYHKLVSLSLPVQLFVPKVLPVDWTVEDNLRDLSWPRDATDEAADAEPEAEPDSEPDTDTPVPKPRSSADIVLLTDCIFSESLVPSLVRTLLAAIDGNRRAVIYAVHEVRNEDANALFVATMRRYFKDVKLVPRKNQAEGFRHESVQIMVAKRRRRSDP